MRLGARLVLLLTADATMSALVGTRVHPGVMTEGEAPPAIVYSIDHNEPLPTVTGPSLTRSALVTFGCYARHYEDAHAIADALEAILVARSGPGLSFDDGPIMSSHPRRRDLPVDYQPQWFHVSVDVEMLSTDV